MKFDYKKFIKHLLKYSRRREAGFIHKFYVEKKCKREIIEEMFINSAWYYYNLKKRCKDLIASNFENKKFLIKD